MEERGRKGAGIRRASPALSAHSFRANSVSPFHPWLVRNSVSCGLFSTAPESRVYEGTGASGWVLWL